MQGPLDARIYDTGRPVGSWWEASAPPPAPRVALDGAAATEVAIVGGGYAGLSAALRLGERGVAATVLEAGEVGWGASGRNGGIVGYGGTKLSDAALVRRYGRKEAARADRLQTEGLRWLRAFCEAEGLGAHVQGEGELLLAHSRPAARALARLSPPEGGEVSPVAPSGRRDIGARGGVRIGPSFGVHPLRLGRAMAGAAERAGARVHPRSEVVVWERRGARHRLVTPGGSLTAERVLIATNGFTPERLVPELAGRTVPVISNIAVTRPLTGAERARHPWLGDAPASDTRNLLAYFRMLPEGRLLFGMRGDLRGSDAGAARMRRRVAARLAAAFPGWADAEIEHFWRGPICATPRLTPAVGRLAEAPSVHHALGWHGSGINMGTLAGRLIADAIATGDETAIPAPWRGLPPRLPLPGLRPAYVGAAMAGYRVLDRLG